LKPKEEEGAGIVPLAPRARGFIQPTLIELRKMQTDIVRRFPMITLPEPGFREDPQTAVENFAEQIDAAFLAIAHMARAASPDCKRAGWYWIEHCADVLRALGVAPPALTLPAFVIAALMHNDVPFTSLATNPHGLSFGLKFWGDGGAATDAWRKTLAGQLPTPARRKPGVLFFSASDARWRWNIMEWAVRLASVFCEDWRWFEEVELIVQPEADDVVHTSRSESDGGRCRR
jgi:NAD(P)-dependent dehydrogenase (short-subunit alcohol dehydrogenase family)